MTRARARKTTSVAENTATASGDASGHGVEERIRRRAYELYCSRGHADGGATDDWLTAERELRSTHSATEGSAETVLELLNEDSLSDARR